MKNHGLFLTSIIAFLAFSCNNDQEVISESTTPGEPAVISINLVGSGNELGRATGTPTSAEESKVNDGIIYVFNANGEVLKKAYFKTGDITGTSGNKQILTTTAASSISVLLNTGVSDSASMVGTVYDVPTKSKLEALTFDLALTNGTGAGTQVKDNLLMSGKTTSAITYTGTPKSANVEVTVSRIVSKVVMNWSFEPNSTFTNKIRLVGAVVLNVPLSSHLFGNPLTVANTKYLEGLPDEVLNAFPASGYRPANGFMVSNVNLLAISNFNATVVPENHFYIFENTNTSPTIVAIVADFNENGIDLPTPASNIRKYYPIVINKATTGLQDGTMTIKRNVTYNVKATVKGIGVDNPFEPVDPAILNVTVTVADWALIVNANQTFE